MNGVITVTLFDPVNVAIATVFWNYPDGFGSEWMFPIIVKNDNETKVIDFPVAARERVKFKEGKEAFVRVTLSKNKRTIIIFGELHEENGYDFAYDVRVIYGPESMLEDRPRENIEYEKIGKIINSCLKISQIDLAASLRRIAQPFMNENTLKRKEKDQLGKRKHDPRLMADLFEARKQAKEEKIAKLLAKRKSRP